MNVDVVQVVSKPVKVPAAGTVIYAVPENVANICMDCVSHVVHVAT